MIRLMTHNDAWKQDFEQAKSSLLTATEGWLTNVFHVGATAVESQVAQPVVDLIATIDGLKGLNEAAVLAEGINYERIPTPSWCDPELTAYLTYPRHRPPQRTLLIVSSHGKLINQAMFVQKKLTEMCGLRGELATLKLSNAEDPAAYEVAKQSFFELLCLEMGH